MFSAQPSALIILRRDSLEVATPHKVFSFPLAETVYFHLEVINPAEFSLQMRTALEQAGLEPNSSVLLLLADSLLLQKIFTPAGSPQTKAAVEQFLESLPFDPQTLLKVQIEREGKLLVQTTNGEPCFLIQKVLQEGGSSLAGVLSRQSFEEEIPETIQNASELTLILSGSAKARKRADFLASVEQPEAAAPSPQKSTGTAKGEMKRRPPQWLLAVLALLLFVGAGVLLAGAFGLFRFPWVQDEVVSEVMASPLPESTTVVASVPASESAQTEPNLDKSEITIEIQNGSGIAGQASVLQGELEELGYTLIEASNAASPSARSTIRFSERVPVQLKSEVLSQLDRALPSLLEITGEESDDASSADILLITGN